MIDSRLFGDLCHTLDDVTRIYEEAAPHVSKRAVEILVEHREQREVPPRRIPRMSGEAAAAIDEGKALIERMGHLDERLMDTANRDIREDDLISIANLYQEVRRLTGRMRAASHPMRLRWLRSQIPPAYVDETLQRAARTEPGHIEHVAGIVALYEAEIPSSYVRSTGLDIDAVAVPLIISCYSASVPGEYVAAASGA